MEQLPSVRKRDYNAKARRRSRRLGIAFTILMAGLAAVAVEAANLPDTIDKIRPAVVAVGTYSPTASPRQQFRGTGFVVGNGRFIVTNSHVVPDKVDSEQHETIAVFSGRGREARYHPARLIGRDVQHDLALLSIGTTLPTVKLGDASRAREGEEIALTGFPIGMALGLYPVTHRGIVSAISPMAPPQMASKALTSTMIRAMRDPYDVLQLDVTAYPGNSGSPVYDQNTGQVIGVVNSVLVKATKEAAIASPSGITYAIPVRFVRQLMKTYGV